ncbi:ParB/RepB/Spo0J family partition protein [Streptomyces sp. NRRL F-2890]|uniref:ParB/RepB/Spo0J family partition protein n=1 Tax=Streptomyces sp. NRRL F-2890 TaxID=1463845 RepID=UPI0005B786AB|nr:ParB/RepB/Spo0J family partition protein [Streptomyces sp. NRRL F-2890]
MSKKDKLGAGASFGRAQAVSARRAAISAATEAPTVGTVPPSSVKLEALVHNPFNPRDELTELEETAASLKEKGQIQPLAVVRKAAFLAVHPDQAETLGAAEYVVIDGNRRLAAASIAGLAELRIDVNDSLAATAADMLEGALIANIHRVDVPPLDQAKAIQELVDVHGSQAQVAKRLGKTPAWVSQRLALLELTPELQNKVETGELKVEPARRIGRLPKEEQAAAAEETVNAVNTPRQRRARRTLSDGPASPTVNAVNTPETPPAPSSPEASTVNAVNTSPGAKQVDDTEIDAAGLPWNDPNTMHEILTRRMTPDALTQLGKLLLEH